MSRKVDHEIALSDAYDRLTVVYGTLDELLQDADGETGARVSGCKLIVGDVLEEVRGALEEEEKI